MFSLTPSKFARRMELGFTLVELLIVVIILAVLSSIVIPQFSQFNTGRQGVRAEREP
jgi:prepilin-type N-terminal cleavage/methylation domain-containing protein